MLNYLSLGLHLLHFHCKLICQAAAQIVDLEMLSCSLISFFKYIQIYIPTTLTGSLNKLSGGRFCKMSKRAFRTLWHKTGWEMRLSRIKSKILLRLITTTYIQTMLINYFHQKTFHSIQTWGICWAGFFLISSVSTCSSGESKLKLVNNFDNSIPFLAAAAWSRKTSLRTCA